VHNELALLQRGSLQNYVEVGNLKLRMREDENIVRELNISEELIKFWIAERPVYVTGVRNNSGLFIHCLEFALTHSYLGTLTTNDF
jgi:hypothetical protein